MRVGLDAGPLLDPPTGIGRYTRELADALELQGAQVVRYAVALGLRADAPDATDIARWRMPARLMQLLWRRLDRPAITRLTGPVDVVHGTNFVLPALGDVPAVVTIHDLSFSREDTFPGGERLRELVPWSIERASKLLVPTQYVAAEVADAYGCDPESISVTHEGVAPRFFGASPLADTLLGRMGIPGPFILAVGTLEPRKNLHRLLEAWRGIRSELPDWSLVLAGPAGWGPDLPRTDGVILTGWVGDETLPGLLAAATVFCYPSLYEGFGLPPLEAMAAGTPVVAGDYGCATEVLGDAAVRVDPHDVDDLAAALLRLAGSDDERKAMQVAGRARATRFTWERAAQATFAAYEDVVDR